jgi:hypothetical protein
MDTIEEHQDPSQNVKHKEIVVTPKELKNDNNNPVREITKSTTEFDDEVASDTSSVAEEHLFRIANKRALR